MTEEPHPMDGDAPFVLSMMLQVIAAVDGGDREQAGKLMGRMLRESSDPATTAAELLAVLKGSQP